MGKVNVGCLAAVCAALLGMGVAATAGAAEDATLRITLGPGQVATARVDAQGSLAVVLPSGRQQRLEGVADADGDARLGALDVDFDGRPELVARAAVGQVNEAVAVYRFDPAQARFVPLAPPDSPHAQCGGLMGLDVDAAHRTLSSSCRSGPMWYVDQYRYHDGRLYLYRAERLLMLGDALEATIFVKQTADSGPMAVWTTFDPAGKVLDTAIGDGLVAPDHGHGLLALSGQVVPARVPLHARPGDTATRRYLVRDDRVELLDEQDGWVKVRYANPSRGDILGWVDANP
ncbi:SH3 domain-containing protein [Stenotrophomonas sp.]|uniref:SH3 domain-containing protein n=1 Tax=Stenotrophomonas sp. TaxID=69392 RepID=UPI002FC88B46